MTYFDINSDLIFQIVQQLKQGDHARCFHVIEDAIPINAEIIKTECIGHGVTRVYFTNGEDRQYTPTLSVLGGYTHYPVEAVEWFDPLTPEETGKTAITVSGFIGPVRSGDSIIYKKVE